MLPFCTQQCLEPVERALPALGVALRGAGQLKLRVADAENITIH